MRIDLILEVHLVYMAKELDSQHRQISKKLIEIPIGLETSVHMAALSINFEFKILSSKLIENNLDQGKSIQGIRK